MPRDASERLDDRGFLKLRQRLQTIERRYNPKGENLHFECLAHGDADLYPELLRLANDALKEVKRFDACFATHDLYEDGMIWYDLFLLTSAAANRVRADGVQKYISETTIDDLFGILVQIARYSTVEPGDISKRNYEALGNTLLAFYSKDRIQLVRREARLLPDRAKGLVRSAIRSVEEIRAAQ